MSSVSEAAVVEARGLLARTRAQVQGDLDAYDELLQRLRTEKTGRLNIPGFLAEEAQLRPARDAAVHVIGERMDDLARAEEALAQAKLDAQLAAIQSTAELAAATAIAVRSELWTGRPTSTVTLERLE